MAGVGVALLGAGVLPGLTVTAAQAADGQGFSLNSSDLRFIMSQIRIAERHAATPDDPADPCAGLLGTAPDQIPNQNAQGGEVPWGLRTVDGTCNNLRPGTDGAGKPFSDYGAADEQFPRRATPVFGDADNQVAGSPIPGNGAPTSYARPGTVYDSGPRLASNLIVDQTDTNPAAVDAAQAEETTPGETLFIENVAPDEGLSAPFNSTFTLFGQFFDHGLDLVNKGAGSVIVPLQPEDPLFVPGGRSNFMILSRAVTTPGANGVPEANNQTSAYVDQSQTYTSHPSHQVFLREYEVNEAGAPVGTGRLLNTEQAGGEGLATWATTKAQAADLLGIQLTDRNLELPLLVTDEYGQFIPGANGFPQMVLADGTRLEGDPAADGGAGVPVPANAVLSGHAFLDDIAHNASPKSSQTGAPLVADDDTDINPQSSPRPAGRYDDELLNAHFVAGDGRINENIGLTAIHHVFHSEHNRLVAEIDSMVQADPALLADYQAPHPVDLDGDGSTDVADASFGYGNRLFQAARFVTEMQYQHLAFEEFARKVQPMVNIFDKSYDSRIDAAITAEFAHAVYRFGHSMLTETVARTGVDGTTDDISLLDAFLNPPSFYEDGRTPEEATGDIIRGMTAQRGNEIDEFVTEALRSNLLGLPLDLATLNIARARETGVPPLNEARRQFHELTGDAALAPYGNWIDFGLGLRHENLSLVNFVAAYGTHPTITGTMEQRRAAAALLVSDQPVAGPDGVVIEPPADAVEFMNAEGAYAAGRGGLDDVDLWVGGLAEKTNPFGGLLGSTFNFIFETQMEDLQDGDRLYYLNRLAGLNLLVQMEGNSFAELISRNSDASNLPADVFSSPDFVFDLSTLTLPAPGRRLADNPATPDVNESLLMYMADRTIRFTGPEHVLFVGTPNADRMQTDAGDDTLRGNEVNDRMEGGAGNDQLIGGSGEDIITDSFGDDVLKGGNGNDALASGAGAGGDLNMGGLGNDFVVGGNDITETFAGPGNDMVFAGDSIDVVFGDDGDDWIEGGNQPDLLQGDNGAPFQDDPNTPGHDVINGQGGPDDYDAEGGDDIMVAGPGVERAEGMRGFDWVTHKNSTEAANDDLEISVLLPDAIDTLRDRFDLVEALSGGNLDDVLRGDDTGTADLAGENELTAEGIARITGLAGLLPAGTTSFTGGNIIIGGSGSDTIEGRGGDDVIDGDVWLDVQLRAPNAATPATDDVLLYDSMMSRPVGAATTVPTLRAEVFAGRVNPGDIQIVRSIVNSAAGTFTDTAVYSGPLADYDVTRTANGLVVNHARGLATDGIDTLRNIERVRFTDQTISGAITAPDAPSIISVVGGNARATVNFTPPARDGGSEITEFRVEVLTGTTVERTVTGISPTATSTVVTGLTNGTAYTFRVIAVNAVGASAPSASSAAVTPVAPLTVPAAPAAPTATAGAGSATVTWAVPADGGSAITSYRIQVRSGTTVVRTITGIAPTATSQVVTGLTNGTGYTFRVQAVNAVGTSALSAPSTTVTPATVPGAPSIGTATAGNASATVRWAAPANGGSAITGYEVEVRSNGVAVRTVTGIAPTATSTVVTGLTNGTGYYFRVRAVNAMGTGPQSGSGNTVVPATVPGTPVTPVATQGAAGGALTASVSWVAPTNTGGSAITGYRVRALRMNADGTVAATTTSTLQGAGARSLAMTLPAGNYRFTVQAVNAVGSSPQSNRSNQVTAR